MQTTQTTKFTYAYTIKDKKQHNKSPSLHEYGVTRGQLPQRAGSPGLKGGGSAAAVPQ